MLVAVSRKIKKNVYKHTSMTPFYKKTQPNTRSTEPDLPSTEMTSKVKKRKPIVKHVYES